MDCVAGSYPVSSFCVLVPSSVPLFQRRIAGDEGSNFEGIIVEKSRSEAAHPQPFSPEYVGEGSQIIAQCSVIFEGQSEEAVVSVNISQVFSSIL